MTFNIERELVSEQIYQVETVFVNQGAVMLLAGGQGGPPRIWELGGDILCPQQIQG